MAALGTWAVAVLALSRGEQISALWIVIAGFCALSISYRFYSKWLATKVLVLNEERATPAVLRNDNKDYVPTNRWMVFGHHFAAIAGPGPLVGPVLAAQFGFLPGTLWILIGATLGGGVHDMIVLFASIRRGGKTLGQMVKEEIGRGVGLLALVSVLAIMIILLAVLALVVVQALAQTRAAATRGQTSPTRRTWATPASRCWHWSAAILPRHKSYSTARLPRWTRSRRTHHLGHR